MTGTLSPLEVVISRDQLRHLTSVDNLIVAVKSLSLQTG